MEEELRLKKLHLTYWSLELTARLALAVSMLTALSMFGVIFFNRGLRHPQQQLGELLFVVTMMVLVYIQSENRQYVYGFRGEECPVHNRKRAACEVLLILVAIATMLVALTGGENTEFVVSNGSEVLFGLLLPFSSKVVTVTVLVDAFVTIGCSLWLSLAGIADLNNYVDEALRDQQGEMLSFKRYVRLAAKHAVE